MPAYCRLQFIICRTEKGCSRQCAGRFAGINRNKFNVLKIAWRVTFFRVKKNPSYGELWRHNWHFVTSFSFNCENFNSVFFRAFTFSSYLKFFNSVFLQAFTFSSYLTFFNSAFFRAFMFSSYLTFFNSVFFFELLRFPVIWNFLNWFFFGDLENPSYFFRVIFPS